MFSKDAEECMVYGIYIRHAVSRVSWLLSNYQRQTFSHTGSTYTDWDFLKWMSVPCLCCVCPFWQNSSQSSPVRWRRERELIGIIFTLVCKAMSGNIKCAGSLLSTAMTFRAALRISTSLILSIWISEESKCMSKPDSALKDVFGPKIFVRLPVRMNNLMHFHGTAHELKIKDKSALLPYLHLQQVHNLLSTAVILLAHEDWVQSCGSTITELLCVKIRLPNTSPPAVINLIQYDSLTCFRAAIDLWFLPPSLLAQCWIGSPINCVPINHSSPMFVCRSLWHDESSALALMQCAFLPFRSSVGWFKMRAEWCVMCLTAP